MNDLLTLEDVNTIVLALEDVLRKDEEFNGKINLKVERIQSIFSNLTCGVQIDLNEYDEPKTLFSDRFKIEKL